jgi:hypothetical protein
MCKVVGAPPSGTGRTALSGLHGMSASRGVPSLRHSRQLNVGLQADTAQASSKKGNSPRDTVRLAQVAPARLKSNMEFQQGGGHA